MKYEEREEKMMKCVWSNLWKEPKANNARGY
jgi:hypothetical protein